MVREAWWATVHGIAKELDTTKQLTHTYITKLPYRNVPNTFLLFLFVIGGYLLCSIVLVSAIHQHESAIGVHMSPPS